MILKRFKVKKNGAASYRAEGSTVSIQFPARAFNGSAPDEVEISAENLELMSAAGRARAARQVSPEVEAALKVIADAKAAAKQARLDREANLTDEQRAKREEARAKAKQRREAKKAGQ